MVIEFEIGFLVCLYGHGAQTGSFTYLSVVLRGGTKAMKGKVRCW